jgi:methylmalonyl-CoA mutase N-terminal domain/subunit
MFDEEDLASIREAREDWESETLDPVLEGYGERRDRFVTVSSHDVDRLYTPEDIADLDYEEDLGFPGDPPYTRGVYPTMYRGRTWTMRQFAGFGTPRETNERFHYLVEEGQTGLSTAFDTTSLIGLDSDHPMSDGEVGREGVAVDTLRDVEILFDDIDLGEVSTSFTIKTERDDAAVEAALAGVDAAIASDENVMEPIIDAVKVYATMGEVMSVFEDHYGGYQETVRVA